MSVESEAAGQLAQLWKWAMAAIGAVAAWVWAHTMGRISSLEKGKVGVAEFTDYKANSETVRREFRENQISIFTKLQEQDKTLARIEGKLDR